MTATGHTGRQPAPSSGTGSSPIVQLAETGSTDEWLIRDQGAIVRQLGVEPKQYAADQIEAEGGPEQAAKPFGPNTDRPATYRGTGNDHEAGVRYRDILDRLMRGELATVGSDYDRAVQIELPGGRTDHGRDGC